DASHQSVISQHSPVDSHSQPSSVGKTTDDSQLTTDDSRLTTADSRLTTVFARIEDTIASFALLVMVLLPLAEIVSRRVFSRGIPGSGPIVQHLTLWVGFLGAAIAARDGKLLALATGTFIPPGPWRRAAASLAPPVGAR